MRRKLSNAILHNVITSHNSSVPSPESLVPSGTATVVTRLNIFIPSTSQAAPSELTKSQLIISRWKVFQFFRFSCQRIRTEMFPRSAAPLIKRNVPTHSLSLSRISKKSEKKIEVRNSYFWIDSLQFVPFLRIRWNGMLDVRLFYNYFNKHIF